MRVDKLLNKNRLPVITVDANASIAHAVSLLAAHQIGALVIVNENTMIRGILSERDIVRSLAQSEQNTLDLKVNQLMTNNVYTSTPESSVAELMELMSTNHIRHIPVEKKGKLVGIVSVGDVVTARLKELETERGQLEEYISS